MSDLLKFFAKLTQNKRFLIIFSSLAGLFFVVTLIFSLVSGLNSGDDPKVSENTSSSSISPSSSSESSSEITLSDDELLGLKLTGEMKKIGIDAGFLSISNLKNLNYNLDLSLGEAEKRIYNTQKNQISEPLDDVFTAPENPTKTSRLVWPEYQIDAPIIFSEFKDIFEVRDGKLDFTKIVDNDPVDSPIQTKLKDGVVHLAFSPHPGEIGNSYIIGHSSNFSSVKSDYNEVFKSIERKSKPGEVFTIYDARGRELKFKVFEAIEVKEGDGAIAYKNFGSRRVVTLQGSILENVNGKLLPTKRWLTRGELVLP